MVNTQNADGVPTRGADSADLWSAGRRLVVASLEYIVSPSDIACSRCESKGCSAGTEAEKQTEA